MNNTEPSAPRVAVFGGSQVPRDDERYSEAYDVGARLARAGFVLINGGYTGTMEASARGAREAGGRVVGVTSSIFAQRDVNPYVDEEIPTDDLYSRIRELVIHSDAYVVLRGSIGTLAELQIVWNLATIDPQFRRPIILLGKVWRNVIQAYQDSLGIPVGHVAVLQFASTPDECIELLETDLNVNKPGEPHRNGGDIC